MSEQIKIEIFLKDYRKNNKLTQSAMSELLGVNLNQYQNWEYGVKKPSFTSLLKIIKILKIDMNDLI